MEDGIRLLAILSTIISIQCVTPIQTNRPGTQSNSSLFTASPTLQPAPVGGPNVCRSRVRNYCCPGWTQKPLSGLCVTPICSRACGNGRCVKPNLCLCDGGTIAPVCSGSSRDNGRGGSPPSESSNSDCPIPCLNGGVCVDSKCQCKTGYQGEYCGEPVCREACLNGGRCSGPERCSCVYGFTGRRCEADYRTGPCFTKITGNACGGQLLGVVCTRQLCCATIGKAWGHPCETCPAQLDCDQGHLKNIHSGACIDVDECEAIPGICEGGKCINTPGSFSCQCAPGQTPRDGTSGPCIDQDECVNPGICGGNGKCINTDQGYYCICDRGFIPSQDRKVCIDARQGNCFTSVLRGICRGKLSARLTKRDCCCGFNMGKGWGDENNCGVCPTVNTSSYRELCLEPGQIMKVDECGLRPGICGEHGKCIDLPDGYNCSCSQGFSQRTPFAQCEDINECKQGSDLCQGGRCVNLIGSHSCVCPPGFDVSSDGRFCLDHDECQETKMCTNGVCVNMDGSFSCVCNEGYTLSPTGRACVDIQECDENPRICLSGTCRNTPGSYSCICPPGFTASVDHDFCVDRNECDETGFCTDGRCINMEGSFKCLCNPGYELDPTGKQCTDIDECQASTQLTKQQICSGGVCRNFKGGHTCSCLPGFTLGPDGRTCLDTQRDLCYAQYRDGLCTAPSSTPVSRSTCCCCSVVLGEPMGWGTPCRACPMPNTPEFEILCPHGAGMTHSGDDINECAQNPNVCVHGACSNLVGSGYVCICDRGYQVDATGKQCLNINECAVDSFVCGGGQCVDKPGTFQCICPSGTKYDERTQGCQDLNECEESSETCTNGECLNFFGGYECKCRSGFVLDSSGRVCIDNRKGFCWTKAAGGKCEGNLKRLMLRGECCCSSSIGAAWGSPCEPCDPRLCAECPPGFANLNGKGCVDINECSLHPGICQGGGTCINSDGAFSCICPAGLELDADGTKCIDKREEYCYMQTKHGVCTRPLDGFFLKADCCCTIGRAWGRDCTQCPRPGSEAFAQLCPRGQGTSGQIDVNECAFPGICVNGECRNTVGSYSCRCNPGYALDEDGIQCVVCGNGTCENTPGHFTCHCADGFETTMMMQVCMDKDECVNQPGICRGGRCENLVGSFKCHCPPGLELSSDLRECKDIDECSRTSGICSNGQCENMMGTYQCVCFDGYHQIGSDRAHCEDVNECDINNGGCGVICLNTPGSWSCSCPEGYMLLLDGKTCTDVQECTENTRICNGGKCVNFPGGYKCECDLLGLMPSPDGSTCLDINECRSEPGICGNGHCENSLGSFHCLCEDGFSLRPELGPSCTDEDECQMGNFMCASNAICVNTQGSYECECKSGFTGDGVVCRDVNECSQGDNGGCHQDAQCINTDGSFRCACDPGFEGDGYTCRNVDECSSNPNLCENGHCLDHPGSFRCECEMGFMNKDGDERVCIDIPECILFKDLCVFGRCENIHGMFRCHCDKGYQLDSTGGNCTDIDECLLPQSCTYGVCMNTQPGYKCQCPPNYELVEDGTACVDRRRSQCYLDNGEDPRGRRPFGRRDCIKPIGDVMTKSTCCCSVGHSWGPLCELCPLIGTDEYNALCVGGSGFRPNGDTAVLEDVNECEEIATICEHGSCTNVFGSFICTCDPGYRLDFTKAMCIDINECIESPGLCGEGECQNFDGGFQCICLPGYMLLPTGHECVDMRKESCYMAFNTSSLKCAQPMSNKQTKMLCCCSMGVAWGDACLPCPKPATPDYASLCGGRPGQIINPMTGLPEEIDECSLIPQICGAGICHNTQTSFDCECFRGFVFDEGLHTCIDIDECKTQKPCNGNAQCLNLPGAFECSCPAGYRLDNSQRGCIDIEECVERPGICSYGECRNYQGSFQCICRRGFTLTPARDSCIDIQECLANPNICKNGACVNTLGSYKCHCSNGYQLNSDNECEDINECEREEITVSTCRNGRCRNTAGSFTCTCADGYTLTPDGHNCRDIIECDEVPNTCPSPGRCYNIMGSYVCTCPSGYELSSNGNICQDLDECLDSKLCTSGTCINKPGGFVCECRNNYVLSQDGRRCIDERQDYCYDGVQFNGGHTGRHSCTHPRHGYISKTSCCCTGGKGFSSGCELCPAQGTNEFEQLCPLGIGRGDFGEDLDECLLYPGACEGGECVNMDGSYRCDCPPGAIIDSSGHKCIDANECMNPLICGRNGTCVDVEGGFQCICTPGFAPGVTQTCEDQDECRLGTHDCAFRCINTYGSFRCGCPFGYILAPDGKHCNDLDECSTSTNNCKFLCKNLVGTFMCLCPDGYEQVGSTDDCRDVNECLKDSQLCRNGYCQNLPGSYRCECLPGFEQTSDLTQCIDKRQGFCFRNGVGSQSQCTRRDSASLTKTTKQDCCCTMGLAWQSSPRGVCELCPGSNSPSFSDMCMEAGFAANGSDLNECNIHDGNVLCENGVCINTMGSYRCLCNKGYKADASRTRCIDINECDQTPKVCEHICVNLNGSFLCQCPNGYTLSNDGSSCRDDDGCQVNNGGCHQVCENTPGSHVCSCRSGFRLEGERCLDINECQELRLCQHPGTCLNTFGSWKCICPRGFVTDPSGSVCIDSEECSEDRCQHGCQNSIGGYRCTGCPDGYSPHHYYNQCTDENECDSTEACGTAQCRNTLGSYRCLCPENFQFDGNLLSCVQMNGNCVGSPCAFGCSSYGSEGFVCDCPSGYRRIGQGHCLTTITPPAYGGYDIEDTIYSSEGTDRYISTEGCFSCKVGASSRGGRGRRSVRSNSSTESRFYDVDVKYHDEVDDQVILLVPLNHTRPRYRILQLQPSLKQMVVPRLFSNGLFLQYHSLRPSTILFAFCTHQMRYVIKSGNDEDDVFEIYGRTPAALHFKRRIRRPRTYDLEILGYSTDPEYSAQSQKDPFTLRLRLIIVN